MVGWLQGKKLWQKDLGEQSCCSLQWLRSRAREQCPRERVEEGQASTSHWTHPQMCYPDPVDSHQPVKFTAKLNGHSYYHLMWPTLMQQ